MAGTQGFGDGDDEIISGINVTPLVDVVLVLLVIFMVTAPVIYQSSIKVKLPQAKTGEGSSDKSALTFSLNKEGEVFWGTEKTSWDALAKKLVGVTDKEQTVIVAADQATQHGVVVRLMDTLRQAGLTKFSLHVEGASRQR